MIEDTFISLTFIFVKLVIVLAFKLFIEPYLTPNKKLQLLIQVAVSLKTYKFTKLAFWHDKFKTDKFVQYKLKTFKRDILAFNVDIFLHNIFVDDTFTQDTLDAFINDILDVILYTVPVDVISVQFILVDVVLL